MNLALIVLLIYPSLQAASATGSEKVIFEKIEQTNPSMAELDLPESNYAPSNFYKISMGPNQSFVVMC